MAFERIGLYEKAALEFEKAEDYERAAYGFERALMKPEANKMRAKHLAMSATNRVSSNRKNYAEGKSNSANPFSMGDTTKSDIVQMHSFDSGFARENPVANSRPTHLPRIGTQERDILENGSIDNEQMKGFISKQLVFSSLSDAQLNAIDRIKKIRKLAPSSVLIEAGQALSGVFIVVSGKLEVMYERKHQASVDGLLGEGDLIGLDYILTDRNANFTVTCSSPARILELEAGPFLRLVDEDYTFAKELYKNLAVFFSSKKTLQLTYRKNWVFDVGLKWFAFCFSYRTTVLISIEDPKNGKTILLRSQALQW